jgi:hypothetical protein
MITRSQALALGSPCVVVLIGIGVAEISKRLWWKFAP